MKTLSLISANSFSCEGDKQNQLPYLLTRFLFIFLIACSYLLVIHQEKNTPLEGVYTLECIQLRCIHRQKAPSFIFCSPLLFILHLPLPYILNHDLYKLESHIQLHIAYTHINVSSIYIQPSETLSYLHRYVDAHSHGCIKQDEGRSGK